MTNPLLRRLDKLITSSTLPSTVDTDLRNLVELALHAKGGRVESAQRLNEKRREVSDAQRGLICSEVKALPLSTPLHELLTTIRKRLGDRGKAIGDWTILDELRQLRKDAAEASDTESRPTLSGSTLESAQQTSEDQRGQGEREREGQGTGEGIADHQA